MKKIFAFLLLIIPWVIMYQQSDYFIEYERIELVSFNKIYVNDAKIVTYKINRTHPAINATFNFKVDLGHDVVFIAQAYTFMSNEYRLFPIHLGFNFCDAVAKNDFGLGDLVKHSNSSGCPLIKGNFFVTKWAPDASRFPPFIPNGRYMIEVEVQHKAEQVLTLRAYGIVSRPLGRRH